MGSRTTSATFTPVSWDEKEVRATEGPRLARASVVNDYAGGIEAGGSACEYALVYVTEKTGVFSGMEVLTGAVDGREGTFVVRQSGTFDEDGTIRCTFDVAPGSATGALTGLTGDGSYEVRLGAEKVAVTFTYSLA
ncbi:DUF3224 domain-containing protein [Streptomyces diacarni]|uniref:DUF3224 domain-containing protein n=1 Tax=Streptomyces diacarni TaxID=2800381 RepID=A0A367ET33_9ACTN|nr:DUF3224 domain-containing protein [Streptomyces diacarni]RCG20842.1 DUF3224 domain-containing protein [Streptomyces diacarni]